MEREFCHPVFSMESLERAWNIVKRKNTAGGIDDITIAEYDTCYAQRLLKLQKSLYAGCWKPNPYLNIDIPKKDDKIRTIGLLSVEDKIVQTAIKHVMEPYLERTFYPSSFAYRPGKGHVKCVKTAFEMSRRFSEGYYVRCDIDDFFDSVNRDILFNRLGVVFPDKYIVEMTRLCVEMGCVGADLSWHQREKGLPQ